MTGKTRDFAIHARWLDSDGWQHKEETLMGFTFEEAAEEASKTAKAMDKEHGSGHHWNVMLHDHPMGEYGAYFELFHGRTS